MTNKFDLLQRLGQDIQVLYAEDEDQVRASTSELLANFFPNLRTARDGMEALQLWQSSPADLVIADMRMPRMDGVELARKLHEFAPQQRYLVVSAYSDSASLIRLLNEGVSGFLLKPLQVEPLIDILARELLVIHRLRDEERAQQKLIREIEKRGSALDQAHRDILLLTQSRENMLRLVAHQIRNPLNALNGFVRLLQAQLDQSGYSDYFERILEAVLRLETSTQKALDLIRITSNLNTYREPLALEALVGKDLPRPTQEEALLETRVQGNETLFRIIRENVVENFQKYGKPPYETSLKRDAAGLVLCFRDSGCGFPTAILEELHAGPFVSGDIFHHHEGFGLGLALIRTAVEQLGWRLILANRPNGGAEYRLHIPAECVCTP